jgi:hypothetical protein
VTVRRPGKRSAATRAFPAPDGRTWTVRVQSPGASNVMVVFQHPDRTRAVEDRYASWVSRAPEASDVTARLTPATVLDALTDADLVQLFRKSIPIASQTPRFEPG